MLEASVKEYELLSKEVADIRSCITNYVGYIIGSNGIIFLLIRYLGTNNDNLNPILLPLVSLVVISSLYGIINYKFSSHNRHVGYLQLLSQELRHIHYDKKSPISKTEELDKGMNGNLKETGHPQTIMSWQYIMSRWNNRIKEDSYNSIDFHKLDFRFELSSYKYNSLEVYDEKGKENVIHSFLKEIVWKRYNMKGHSKNLYEKFKTRSWQYPKYIYIVALIQVVLMTFYLFFGVNEKPDLDLHKWTVLACVLVVWVYFTWNINQVMRGRKTTDFYCWALFAYRIQMLNNYSIRPVFFSTSFIRYFKSAVIIHYLKKYTQEDTVKKEIEKNCNDISKHWVRKKKKPKEALDELRESVILKLKKGFKMENDLERSFILSIKTNAKSYMQKKIE